MKSVDLRRLSLDDDIMAAAASAICRGGPHVRVDYDRDGMVEVRLFDGQREFGSTGTREAWLAALDCARREVQDSARD